jgi:hypothetical protein
LRHEVAQCSLDVVSCGHPRAVVVRVSALITPLDKFPAGGAVAAALRQQNDISGRRTTSIANKKTGMATASRVVASLP